MKYINLTKTYFKILGNKDKELGVKDKCIILIKYHNFIVLKLINY
jgi:hypothetical protein